MHQLSMIGDIRDEGGADFSGQMKDFRQMNTDKIIWQSSRNLLDSSPNLDRLWEALSLDGVQAAGIVIDFHEQDNDRHWIRPARNCYYNVRENSRRKKPVGSITIAIQLTSNLGSGHWEHGKTAKVFAGYWPAGDDWWMFDVANPDASGAGEDSASQNQERFLWRDGDCNGWFFAVPLGVLNSRDAVKKFVHDPLIAMIGGMSADKAFLGMENEICRPPNA